MCVGGGKQFSSLLYLATSLWCAIWENCGHKTHQRDFRIVLNICTRFDVGVFWYFPTHQSAMAGLCVSKSSSFFLSFCRIPSHPSPIASVSLLLGWQSTDFGGVTTPLGPPLIYRRGSRGGLLQKLGGKSARFCRKPKGTLSKCPTQILDQTFDFFFAKLLALVRRFLLDPGLGISFRVFSGF